MKTGLLYGIVADASSKRVRCACCGVFIPKANKCIEQHTNGKTHKENIEMMSENGISFINGNEGLYCKPCKRTLADDESVTNHIESEDHANWITMIEDLVDGEFISLESYLASDDDKVSCEVCDTSMECTLHNVEEHVNSFTHRSKLCDKLKPLNGIFNVENNDEVWCKICDVYLENTVKSILDHIDDDEHHIEWLADMEEFIEDHDISIEDYLSNEHENKAYCNACQVEILCNTQCIKEHAMSETHFNNLSS